MYIPNPQPGTQVRLELHRHLPFRASPSSFTWEPHYNYVHVRIQGENV